MRTIEYDRLKHTFGRLWFDNAKSCSIEIIHFKETMDQYYFFIFLAPIAAFINISAAIYAWRRRLVPGALMLSLILLSVTGWLIFNSLELIAPTVEGTVWGAKITYLFIVSAPVFWIGFALQYTGRDEWLLFPRFALFWIVPVITFLIVQTNEIHHLMWTSYTAIPVNPDLRVLSVTYGSWFWVNAAYSYILIFTGAFLIAQQHFRTASHYRNQSRWLIMGAVVPIIFNYIYIVRLIPMLKKDFSPIAFSFAGIAFAVGIFRHGLLDIMPIARNTILENMQEGMIIIDHDGRVLDINPAAHKLLIPTEDSVIGKPLENYLPEAKPLFPKDDQSSRAREFTLQRNNIQRCFEGRLSSLRDKKGASLGYILILQDITAQKELTRKIREMASIDSLTKLYNRRHLIDIAHKEIQRANRYQHPLSFLIIDIDHFKKINDAHGHIAGDQILVQFARFLKSILRTTDMIGRYGGDEFVVILPETNTDTALKTANRLCKTAREQTYQVKSGIVNFTLSIGVCCKENVPRNADLYTFIEDADRALYQAKERGRDQIALAT